MSKEHIPNVDDLVTVAENKLEGIDAAIRNGNYSYAKRLSESLIATLQAIERLPEEKGA